MKFGKGEVPFDGNLARLLRTKKGKGGLKALSSRIHPQLMKILKIFRGGWYASAYQPTKNGGKPDVSGPHASRGEAVRAVTDKVKARRGKHSRVRLVVEFHLFAPKLRR